MKKDFRKHIKDKIFLTLGDIYPYKRNLKTHSFVQKSFLDKVVYNKELIKIYFDTSGLLQ